MHTYSYRFSEIRNGDYAVIIFRDDVMMEATACVGGKPLTLARAYEYAEGYIGYLETIGSCQSAS